MRDYNIIDCIIFSNELEMLKMRLDYYYDSVDYFIICEGTKTFSGQDKELVYANNSWMFDMYKDKIIHVVYEPTQEDLDDLNKGDTFNLEVRQRDFLKNKLLEIANDDSLILLSDVDEFPKKEKFDLAREMTKNFKLDAVSFMLKTFYYSPLTELMIGCFGTVCTNLTTLKNMIGFGHLRLYAFNSPHIKDGGYHLSFFAKPEEIQKKIMAYSHQEFNLPEITDINSIKNKMYDGKDILNRPTIKFVNYDQISDEFPIEFYRHEIFFRNTFNRISLREQMKIRRNDSMQIPLEIENLQLSVAKHNPKVIVEIGTARGGTLSRWFEIPSVETIITIDHPEGIHGGQGYIERTYVISDALEQANKTNKEFYAINGDSKHPYLVQRLEELLAGRKIDFLFIDGDHTYGGVKGDFELYNKFLNDDAIVGFHDIIDSEYHREHNCYVSTFWDELKKTYKAKEFIYTKYLDNKILPFFYEHSNHKGGFAGIGLINYGKEKEEEIKNITLLVPVYNNVELTISNINTTIGNTRLLDEVVIYSNGTSDSENEMLKEFSNSNPMINVYFNEKPLGFIKAVNEGIKKCKNELILCLNSDAHLFADWEQRLLPLIKDEEVGLLGPVLCDDFILGCCFMMKKSIINKIGMLNEGFGMGYHDDNELSRRVEKNGYKLGYIYQKFSTNWEQNFVPFPINHLQGISFCQVDGNELNKQKEHNKEKFKKLVNFESVIVFKDLPYDYVKKYLNDDIVFFVVNKSGENFEKIRYDDDIIRMAHIFECTPEMNIDVLIDSLVKEKTFTILDNTMII